MSTMFDRTEADLQNVVALEHVNCRIQDQQLATMFYVTGMGFARDPYLMTGTENMCVNFGRSQFHLPTGPPQVVRGHVGLVVPDRAALLDRLTQVCDALSGTRFTVSEAEEYVSVTSPWGNELRCFEPHPRFGDINLGMPYVEFDVPVHTSEGIQRFYEGVFMTRSEIGHDDAGSYVRCSVGQHQWLLFRETDEALPDYDGHHIQLYVSNFSSPYAFLKERGKISEESNEWQYRFNEIIDPHTGVLLYTLEHEIRSVTNPLFNRALVNRNPAMTNLNYVSGHEGWTWQQKVGSQD